MSGILVLFTRGNMRRCTPGSCGAPSGPYRRNPREGDGGAKERLGAVSRLPPAGTGTARVTVAERSNWSARRSALRRLATGRSSRFIVSLAPHRLGNTAMSRRRHRRGGLGDDSTSAHAKCVPHYESACFDTGPRLWLRPWPWDQSVRIGGSEKGGTWMSFGSRLASAAAAASASAAQQRSAHRHGCGASDHAYAASARTIETCHGPLLYLSNVGGRKGGRRADGSGSREGDSTSTSRVSVSLCLSLFLSVSLPPSLSLSLFLPPSLPLSERAREGRGGLQLRCEKAEKRVLSREKKGVE